MDDFGGKLRQARERRGISLRQIAAITKISAAALEALERNDTSKLPGGIFSRAFVRSYAVEVGLDPEQTVREFLDRFNQEPPPSAAAVAAEIPEPERTYQERQRKALRGLAIAFVAFVVIAAFTFYVFRTRSRQPAPAAQPPAQNVR
jgi:cytoskeleton protein RodZ